MTVMMLLMIMMMMVMMMNCIRHHKSNHRKAPEILRAAVSIILNLAMTTILTLLLIKTGLRGEYH